MLVVERKYSCVCVVLDIFSLTEKTVKHSSVFVYVSATGFLDVINVSMTNFIPIDKVVEAEM